MTCCRCVAEVLVIVAMLSAENVLMQPHKDHAKKVTNMLHLIESYDTGSFYSASSLRLQRWRYDIVIEYL